MPNSPSEHGRSEHGRATGEQPAGLAVVGAGPAGLTAAVTAADLGVTVTLLDAGDRPGGQYHRHPAPELGARTPGVPHLKRRAWTRWEQRLRHHRSAGRIRYLPAHHVWTVLPEAEEGGWALHAVAGEEERAVTVRARSLLLATGAYERQLPFPGWTVPGVVGAGGAQAMLKSGLVLPGRRVLVAGSGPLLLAVAASLAAAGATVPAVVEAAAYTAYADRLGTLAVNPGKALEGARLGAGLARRAVRLLSRHAVTAVHGSDRVTGVTVQRLDSAWRPVPGTGRHIPCDALAVGHGLVPQLELATALGCAVRRTADGTVALALDARQRTSVPGIWSAGEAGGIGGVELALLEGQLAGHDVAHELHGTQLPPRTRGLVRRRARRRAFADTMAAAHRPGPGWVEWLTPETVVCRCEEVPVAEVREAVETLGADDSRTVKLLTRAGMGWCQGRMCAPAVAALAGREPPPESRPLSCPVLLGNLARLPGTDASERGDPAG